MELLWFLLPIAAASGWWAARRELSETRAPLYFLGIRYLFENAPDQEELERALKQTSDPSLSPIDIQLALGNLFRRRGEVDRAIHLHRSLLLSLELNPEQQQRTRWELAEDYASAGLLDRVEEILRELRHDPVYKKRALSRLIWLYQQEREWLQVMAVLEQSLPVDAAAIAHCYCELAEEAWQNKAWDQATEWLEHAAARDPQCARASMLTAFYAMEKATYAPAIAAFQQVVQQQPHFISEILPSMAYCYDALDQNDRWLAWLEQQPTPSSDIFAAKAQVLLKLAGAEQAGAFLTQCLEQKPSLKLLQLLAEYTVDYGIVLQHNAAVAMHYSIVALTDKRQHYRCNHCGFVTGTLRWYCPSCRHWSSILPIEGDAK